MQRRTLLQAALAALLPIPVLAAKQAALPVIEVFKTPTCGCCGLWVEHLQKAGFAVRAMDVPDTTPYRKRFGVPEGLASCHTGMVAGYAVEGHVPAADIKRLLNEKLKARGLAVPGMPLGSPGMEAQRNNAYDVVLIQEDGKHKVYRHYPA